MDIETAFILLFVVATAVAIAARRIHVPYTVALVLAGLVLGGLAWFPAPALTRDLLFSVFLPGLIFEAALHIERRELKENWITILALAVPGVIASTALIALTLTPLIGALHLAPGFGWRSALVFGALISATDPVAVVALFRDLGAPRRLTMLLDAESLLNDGTAVVFFALALSLFGGSGVGARALTNEFLTTVGGGLLVGAAIGAAASLVMRGIDDPMIEITLTTIAAYGAFVTAESLHTSGIIATVAAGILCGNLGLRSGMSASTRVAAATFWEYVTFALNSIVFLLIGFEVHLSLLARYALPILVAYLAVTAGRAVVIAAGRALVGRTRERFPWRWCIVLTWGGLRGALPMVLALSLPERFAYRELIVSMTFGMAVLSILLQGLTMPAVLKALGIVSAPADRTAYEIRNGRLQAAAAALAEIDRIGGAQGADPQILEPLRAQYRRSIERAEEEIEKLGVTRQALQARDSHRLRRRLLAVERDRVMRAFRHGALGRESEERLLADIDARLLALEGERDAPTPSSGPDEDAEHGSA